MIEMKKIIYICLGILTFCSFAQADLLSESDELNNLQIVQITGGDDYENARSFPLSRKLQLQHHQERGVYDFFYLNLKKGQRLEVEVSTKKKISALDDACNAKIALYNNSRVLIEARKVSECNSQASMSFMAPRSAKYYVSIGDSMSRLRKDVATYSANIIELRDSANNLDVGSDIHSSLPIYPNEQTSGYLSANDYSDLYHFKGMEGQKARIQIGSSREPGFSLVVTMRSSIGQVFEDLIVNGTESGFQEIDLPNDGIYSIEVSCFRDTKSIMDVSIPHGNCFSSVSRGGRYKDYQIKLDFLKDTTDELVMFDSWEVRGN